MPSADVTSLMQNFMRTFLSASVANLLPMRWQWSYTGSWEHLDRLGPLLAPVFRALPEWARPCPMSVDLMRLSGQLGTMFALSGALMWSTKPTPRARSEPS